MGQIMRWLPVQEIALRDVTADDWPKNRSAEQRASEGRHCKSTFPRTPHICKSSAWDSNTRRTKESLEEAEYHNRLYVGGNSDWYLEYGKDDESRE